MSSRLGRGRPKRAARRGWTLAGAVLAAAGGATVFAWLAARPPVANASTPQPRRAVDLQRYLGLWYELARYENRFEKDLEAVTAEYRLRQDGMIDVVNTGRRGGVKGPRKSSRSRAKLVAQENGSKFKVSFLGPLFIGDYWILDHDPDYKWSIVGEPSGRFLWLLHRIAHPTAGVMDELTAAIAALGYPTDRLRLTKH